MQKSDLITFKHSFRIKALSRLGIEGIYFSIKKAIYKKTSQHLTEWEKAEGYIRSGTRQGFPF